MKAKKIVFKIGNVRELWKMYNNDEISYSKMCELMNEKAFEAYNKPLKTDSAMEFLKKYLTGIYAFTGFASEDLRKEFLDSVVEAMEAYHQSKIQENQ